MEIGKKIILQTKEPKTLHVESTSAASSGVLGSQDLSYNFTMFSLSWGNLALDGDGSYCLRAVLWRYHISIWNIHKNIYIYNMKYPLYRYSIWYTHNIYTLQYQLRTWWTNARNLLEGVWATHQDNSINCSAAVWLLTDLVSLYLFLFSNVATSLHKSHPYWWAVCVQGGCETPTVESMH